MIIRKSFLWAIVPVFLLLCSSLHARESIDLFCPDVERKEAILTCAFQAGVEVVFLEEVRGKVNLRKDHVRFEEALSLILKGSGVSWFRADGVYYIGVPPSRDALSTSTLPFERYHLNYRKSQEIISRLPEYQEILVAEGERTILILGNENLRRPVLERIQALDAPVAHILVRALVVEARGTALKNLGMTLPGKGRGITVGEVNLGGPFERLETLKAYLESLQGESNLRVRSELEVLVLEGEVGEISTMSEIYYPVRGERELRRVETGTTLRVIPQMVDRDTIRMDVALTVNNLEKNGRSALSVVKRTAQTSVTLREGTLISITGLKLEEDAEKRRKISRRRTSSRRDKTELVVFLQAEKEKPSTLPTIAGAEETQDKIIIPEFNRTYQYKLLLYYASLSQVGNFTPWLGAGFSGQDDTSPWQFEGEFFFSPAGQGKGEITLRYPLKEDAYLALRWSKLWGELSRSAYAVYLGARGSLTPQIEWHAGLGAHLSGSRELSFAFLELRGEDRDLSLKTGLLYQWQHRNSNLWFETEGRFALGRRTSFFIGYRECIAGEPIDPFDEFLFRGLYAGILFKL